MDKNSSEEPEYRPSPADFELYLPWACTQLQLESTIQVTKVYQHEYVSAVATDRSKKGKSRAKMGPSHVDVAGEQEKEEKNDSEADMNNVYEKRAAKIVKIQAIYDFQENLVQIKFVNNNHLPRIMFKIIGLIIQFQSYLNTITIYGGLDPYTIYEMCKFLSTTHITDLCLDDCYLKEPNYQLLLEKKNFLKYLSLCRCKIDDMTVEVIFSKLIYPLPASKTLSVLNLSSNKITDEGTKFIADALRTNRQLSYLNLASNMITDKGAFSIFGSLLEFPLTTEDLLISKARYMTYLQNKNEMIALTVRDLKLEDADKRSAKRKSLRPTSAGLKKLKADSSQKSLLDPVKCLADVDSTLIEKAEVIVESVLGEFTDPFSNNNTFVRNGLTFCKGNNSLCCLNMSYNYLSYISLNKIKSVLLHQKLEGRASRGLLSVSIEGNCVPITCKELLQIDDILEINLMSQTRKLSSMKKRPQSKTIR